MYPLCVIEYSVAGRCRDRPIIARFNYLKRYKFVYLQVYYKTVSLSFGTLQCTVPWHNRRLQSKWNMMVADTNLLFYWDTRTQTDHFCIIFKLRASTTAFPVLKINCSTGRCSTLLVIVLWRKDIKVMYGCGWFRKSWIFNGYSELVPGKFVLTWRFCSDAQILLN